MGDITPSCSLESDEYLSLVAAAAEDKVSEDELRRQQQGIQRKIVDLTFEMDALAVRRLDAPAAEKAGLRAKAVAHGEALAA
eukprot:gene8617-66217_t